ncbi:MAG TPA: hypothetical protein VMZ28_08960 [Kofleriaceae bacterium]|nr:hypothetical protein [Kofleriaceae bacterium]
MTALSASRMCAYVVLVLGMSGGVARGAAGDVLLLPVEAAGPVPAKDLQRADKSLAEYAVGIRVVPAAERKAVARTGCKEDAACWAEIGRALKGRRVIGSTLTPAGSHMYGLTILLVDVESGAVLSRIERKLTAGSLAAAPRRQLSDVLWQAPSDSAAQPAQATAEPAPVAEKPVAAGPAPAAEKPVVAEAAPAPAEAVAPTPSVSASPSRDRPRRGVTLLRPLKWATAGVALAAIAAGAALLAIDGTGGCAKAAGQRQCAEVFDTLGGGAALVAVGGALAATSVVLFVLDRRWGPRKSWAAAAFPTQAGVMATVGGRF